MSLAPAERLHVRDGAFRRPDGSVWKYRGLTAFTALDDALRGRWDKLEQYAAWSEGIGVNAWRVFAIWGNVRLQPSAYADYYGGLTRLAAWLNQRGIVLHLVAFCDQVDGSPVTLSTAEQDTHLRRVVSALAGAAAIGELVNEDWKNGRIAGRFAPAWLVGLPWTRSSAPIGDLPSAPGAFLQYTTHHTPRDAEWPAGARMLVDVARLGFAGHAATLLPAIAGEPIRIDEATADDYADYAALAELCGAGACLHGGFATFDASHTTDLQNCTAPVAASAGDRVARAVADVWAAGIDAGLADSGRFVPGDSADSPLAHDDRHALLTSAMVAGTRAVAVVVRPTTDFRVGTQRGWRVTRRVRNLFFCER